MSSTAPPGLSFADAPGTWDLVSAQLEGFITAWEGGTEPPVLSSFLPAGSAAVRRLLIVELIKVDLEYRWLHRRLPKRVEEYAEELPEIGPSVPCDLLYEEFHVRKQAGEQVQAQEYIERFPQRADELRRLFGLQRAEVSTSLFRGGKAAAPAELQLGERLDDFDLLARLGKGAFASVYLARQCSMQRLVALKVSSRRSDEPQTLAQLDHPNIVRVFDQREVADKGLRLLYMEYVPGGTLQEVVERLRQTPAAARSGAMLRTVIEEAAAKGALPIAIRTGSDTLARVEWSEVVCRLGLQLASALAYAHRKNTLHRDIKPANVLLAADGTPKLADFNISYSSKLEGATPAAFFGGSLAYMAPEQLEACNPQHDRQPEDLDGRSDIYSLGVLLWELLVGSRPFENEEVNADWSVTLGNMAALRRRGVEAASLAHLPKHMCPGLLEVLLRCLDGDPQQRFANAEELARQLHLCLQPNVQRLLRPSGKKRWYNLARMHPMVVTSLIALLPNGVLSVIDVMYDWYQIVAELAQSVGPIFVEMIILWKAVLYSIGIVVGVSKLMPVFRAVAGHCSPENLPSARRWCLKMADLVFWISVAAWVISGFLFPAWINASGQSVGVRTYFHFLASHLLCGLIAGTFCFFLLTFLAVHVYYPRLLDAGGSSGELDAIMALRRRIRYYSWLAVTVPFLAMLSLAFVADNFRAAYVAMVVLAAAVLWVAFQLNREIQTDLDALTLASADADQYGTANPGSDLFRKM